MKAEIITSGTELLLGEITDVNTPYIAAQLAALGIDLYYTSAVGDNLERFTGVLKQAFERSDIIFITGGLGPTQGDITRNVIAGLMGEKLAVNEELKKEITAYFAGRGVDMPENNLRQATLIPSAEALHNVSGTAPGWWVEKSGKIIVSMPGPPGEMQDMWQKQVLPRLKARSGAVILSRTLKSWGLSEAKVDQLVSPFLSLSNPTLALYARQDGINLRITAKAATQEAVQKMLRAREEEIRKILGENIWGVDEMTMEGEIGRLLGKKKLNLAVAESSTGGLLAYSLTGAVESRGFFRGGVVLPVDEVSAAAALKRAAEAREKFRAHVGLAIAGDYDSKRQSAGGRAFIAVDINGATGSTDVNYPGRLTQVARRIVNHALVFLINTLK
ncbi:MAG TPA: CinA family nicotinamide mononucleotide deamidase-related protein [Dehalococcoidales bacterium]|nr:CinA family nicotinamide mononucleotide deamidase-related protein [Dehalococcoidales bacterium]